MDIRPLTPVKKDRKKLEKPRDLVSGIGVNTLTPRPLEPIPSYDGFTPKPPPQGAVMGTNDELRSPQGTAMEELNAPPPLAPQQSELEKLEAAKRALLERGQEKAGIGSKLLYSLFEGMQTFANPGRGPIQPLENVRFQNSVDNLDRRLAPLYSMRDKEVAYKKSLIEQQTAGAQAFKAQNEAIRSANPHMYDSFMKDQVITAEESEQASAAGLGYIAPGDYREFKDREQNGEIIATPTIGRPNWQTTNAPIDPAKRETPIMTQLPNNGPWVQTTGNKALDRGNQIEVANTQYLGKAAETNRAASNEESKSLYNYEVKEQERIAKANQLADDGIALTNKAAEYEKDVANIEAQIAQLPQGIMADPKIRENLEKRAQNLREKARDYRTQGTLKINEGAALSKQKIPAPPALSRATAPALSTPKTMLDPKSITVDSDWLDRMVKESSRSKSPKTREQIIQELKKKGYTVTP